MTTVAGLVAGGRVWLGADRACSDGNCRREWLARKVGTVDLRVKRPGGQAAETAVLGVAGRLDVAAWTLARPGRFWPTMPPAGADDDDLEEWAAACAVRWYAGAVEHLPDDTEQVGSQVLLGARGRLWEIEDRCALRMPQFEATGSGATAALGALHVMVPLLGSAVAIPLGWDPEGVVRAAVTIACAVDPHSARPVDVVATPA